jgi:methylated-DNA-[protein]-cysteine S-methyltransferase
VAQTPLEAEIDGFKTTAAWRFVMNDIKYFYKIIKSPVGKLKLVATEKGLTAILWEKDDPRRVPLGPMKTDPDNRFLKQTEKQLNAYFNGQLKKFTVPLDFKGTDFQKSVWAALLTIPFGETRSYGEIARQIGRPQASRAVGAANGRNPISIIAPCHRVLGSNGKLTGFAGGLEAKDQLLKLEGRDPLLGLAGQGLRQGARKEQNQSRWIAQ